MADELKPDYDTSIGTKERSVVAATKVWGIVLGFVLLLGVIMLTLFLMRGSEPGAVTNSGNTVTATPAP